MNESGSNQHQPPRTLYAMLEFGRAVQEITTLLPANRWLSGLPGGDGQPVMTLPGFGGADGSTALLRRYIGKWGYEAHPWAIGRNMDPGSARDMGGVLEFMNDVVKVVGERLHAIRKKSGKRVSLVGWSLGGLYSRQLAATYPDLVRQVITLGTPFGDPRSTIVWPIMRRFIDSPEPPEADMARWMEMARAPLEVPLSIIWSRTDGFVHPQDRLRARRPPHREYPRLQQPRRFRRQSAGVLRRRRPPRAARARLEAVRAQRAGASWSTARSQSTSTEHPDSNTRSTPR